MVYWSGYKVSLSMLKDSLKRRSIEFLKENSTHAVPYFVDPFKSIYERIMWVILFNISFIAGFATMIIIWQKFQSSPTEFSPTLTYLNIERDNMTVDFPTVYLCYDKTHLNFMDLKPNQVEVLKSLYHMEENNLESIDENVNITKLQEYYLKIIPECSQFFSECEFRKDFFDCSDTFGNKIATPNGICCIFTSKTIEIDDLSWSFRFQSHQYPISVYLMGKFDDPPIYKQQPNYVLTDSIIIDLSFTITTTASSVHFLTRSQRKCTFLEESSSHINCERNIMKAIIKEKCNCLPWFYANHHIEECSFSGYKCLYHLNIDEIKYDKCYVACNHTSYTIEKIQTTHFLSKMDNFCEIRLSNWPDVRFRRVTRFGWLDLLVSFGGAAGFFIGFSSITTFEVLYYFTSRVYCGAVLSKPKTRYNIQMK